MFELVYKHGAIHHAQTTEKTLSTEHSILSLITHVSSLSFNKKAVILAGGLPFIVLGIVLALDSLKIKGTFKSLYLILTVIYAQFWLKIIYTLWISSDSDDLLVFPKQLYFMHFGLWMSWSTYLIQFITIIISAILLRRTINQVGPNHTNSSI